MSDAKVGYGILFKVGDGASPEAFTSLAEVMGISGPGMSRDSVDITHTASPSLRREFLPGLIDEGEFTVNLNLTSGANTILRAEYAKTVPTNYQIVFPSGAANITWQFTGFMTGYDTDDPIEDRMTATATFKITGASTIS